jgi:TRAP-type C4-dicarboxylate transport system permease small subunit
MTARLAYRISLAIAAIYVVWVLASLVAQRTTGAMPFRLGDLGEFLLVLVGTCFFVWGLALDENSGAHHGWLKTLDENAERYAMLVAYLFVCIVIVQEVLRRFGLNFSSAWSQETAQYLFIYLGYIGAAYGVKERAHIRFDVLISRVGERAKGWLYIFAELCTIAFALIAVYWSLHTVVQLVTLGGTTPVLRINKAWFEIAVPLGFTLVVFRSLQAIARDWCDMQAGRPVYAGKAMFDE